MVQQQQPTISAGDDLDPLDMALMQMNVQSTEPQPFVVDNATNFFAPPPAGGSSLPHFNPIASQVAEQNDQNVNNQPQAVSMQHLDETVAGHFMVTPSAVSETPPLAVNPTPPPPMAVPSPALSGPTPTPSPPMAATGSEMMPPPMTVSTGGNPFKRTGSAVHRNLAFNAAPASAASVINPQTMSMTPPTQATPPPPPPATVEPPMSIPVAEPAIVQEQSANDWPEVVPAVVQNNDRNEYLQTDPLSEEVTLENSRQPETFDHLPPPGLSRLVLGETEDHQSTNIMQSQPSVLNRMVPGTDLEGPAADVTMQRTADGQDDDSVLGYPTTAVELAPTTDLTDRNLYQVAGESHQEPPRMPQQIPQHPPSRVVTGDENTLPFGAMGHISSVVNNADPIGGQLPIEPHGEEPRDLQPMDGENACDDDNVRFNRQHGETVLCRDEPIEGQNAGDDVVISSGGGAAATTSEVADISSIGGDGASAPSTHPNPRKETSTGEDSDRVRAPFYKSKSGRKHEENTGSLRRKPKQHERYDSESDNSDKRDHRKHYERSYVSDRQRNDDRDGGRRRREGGNEELQHSRRHRSDRDRRRDDEYDRGYGRGGEDRRSKRYNDDDREDRRKNDGGDAKRAEKERQYRKDRDRDREERRGDDPRKYRERDRRYDYEDERYNRSGSRNTDRSRDPRYAGSGYYGQSEWI